MSDEMFEIIGTKIDTLVGGHASLETRVGEIDTRLSGVDTRLTGVETQLGTVVDGQARLEAQMVSLIDGQTRMERRADKLEISQEDMRENIRQIAEGHAAIQAHFDRRFDELQETLDRRLTPLEAAIRKRR
jgi:chromosome segregation ATPase